MSSKLLVPALAAQLGLVMSAPGSVLALDAGSHHYAHPYGHYRAYGFRYQPDPIAIRIAAAPDWLAQMKSA